MDDSIFRIFADQVVCDPFYLVTGKGHYRISRKEPVVYIYRLVNLAKAKNYSE